MRLLQRFLLAFIPAFNFAAAAFAGDEARMTEGWIKTYAAAPLDKSAIFEAPDYHGSLIEASARRAIEERLVALGYQKADAPGGDILTISVSVKAPEPKGRKPLPKSPIQIAGVDRNPFDNIYDPELRAEWVDVEKKRKAAGADELSVTIYARRGDQRVWSGYAGAALGGASREDLARGLAEALLDHFGDDAAISDAAITLAAAPPAVTIIEAPAENQ